MAAPPTASVPTVEEDSGNTIKWGKKPHPHAKQWSSKRVLRHYFDNNPAKYQGVWTEADNTWDMGYYVLPYKSMKASMEPQFYRNLLNENSAVSIGGYGFNILTAEATQIEAKISNDTNVLTVQKTPANVMMIYDTNRFLSDMTIPLAGTDLTHFNDINSNMELPFDTFPNSVLKGCKWKLYQNWVLEKTNEKYTVDKKNPPFNLYAMGDIEETGVEGLKGKSHTYTNEVQGWFPTGPAAMLDPTNGIGIPGSPKNTFTQDPMPQVLDLKDWPSVSYDTLRQHNKTDIGRLPPHFFFKGSPQTTRKGDILIDYEIKVEYFAWGWCIPIHDNIFFHQPNRYTRPLTPVASWLMQNKRTMLPINGYHLHSWDHMATFDNDDVTISYKELYDLTTQIAPQAGTSRKESEKGPYQRSTKTTKEPQNTAKLLQQLMSQLQTPKESSTPELPTD